MKTIINFLLILFLTTNAISQTKNIQFTKADYLQKSKKQKTTGWVLLGGGTTAAVVGVIIMSNSYLFDSSSNSFDTGGFLLLGGLAADLVSIPFFISSGSKARKAATFSMNYQEIYIPHQNTLTRKTNPSITLRIGL